MHTRDSIAADTADTADAARRGVTVVLSPPVERTVTITVPASVALALMGLLGARLAGSNTHALFVALLNAGL